MKSAFESLVAHLLQNSYIGSVILALFVCFFCLILFCAFLLGRVIGKNETRGTLSDLVRAGREDAVKRSRAVLGGQMMEQVAPFLHNFPCNPADVRFVGKPIDFVAFPGATEGLPIEEVLLIEVKTGSSTLSKREREIKKAVDSGHVRYVVYQPDELSDQ